MKNVIKRLCSAIIAVITLITGTAIPVMAEKMPKQKNTQSCRVKEYVRTPDSNQIG